MDKKEGIRFLQKALLDMSIMALNPPTVIVHSIEDAINRTPNLSAGQINRFRGFTLEGYERLLEENEKLKQQLQDIREILGDDNEQDPDYID